MSHKNDDLRDNGPFDGLRTTNVLREANIFNDRQLDARRCADVITKILFLFNQGETFTPEETTQVFFSLTKLFQSPQVHLRRMIYLLIKVIVGTVPPDQSLIVVSSLSKDMTSQQDMFRANAIRVLAHMLDPSMISSIERFLKQSVVDRNSFIVSSALIAGQHLHSSSPDVVKRWSNEVQDSLRSKSKLVQYHSLALLYQIKRHDRNDVKRVVSNTMKNPPKGMLAQLLQVRMISKLLLIPGKHNQEFENYLFSCLRDHSSMVMLEAARSICALPYLDSQRITPAVHVLADFLTSQLPVHKFAAVRTLSQVVVRHPVLVSQTCSVDLEHSLTDNNRNIATLAITTLLKTGVEANVDRLMKSISGFMADITDEFKMVLVDAIKTLALKFKHKYKALMGFLASALREEGGLPFKQAIVNAIITIFEAHPEALETGLEQFCEFIEDCEFPELTVQILQLLGEKGPMTTQPSIYIRFIFNRIILEGAAVRAAAVSALARLGVLIPSLSGNVCMLLERCLKDNNDEVRDRAGYLLMTLQSTEKQLATSKTTIFSATVPKFRDLEYSLAKYLEVGETEEGFTLEKNLIELQVEEEETEDDSKGDLMDVVQSEGQTKTQDNPYFTQLNSIPDDAGGSLIKALGPIFKSSSSPIELTESETEYVVNCVKHIYNRHVILQFNVTNTMEDQLLENISVDVEGDGAWTEKFKIPIAELKPQQEDATFICIERPEKKYSSGPLVCTLNFKVKEWDAAADEVLDDGEGMDDEYSLEDCEVVEADFMKPPAPISLLEFRGQWENKELSEKVKKYSLGLDSLQGAVDAVVELLGLQPIEHSGTVPDGVRSHTVNLAGEYVGGVRVLARAGFLLDAKPSVVLKIAVRSSDPEVTNLLVSAVR